MNTDLEYAIKQLRGIDLITLAWGHGCRISADRVRRALDALERVQEQLKKLETDPHDA